MKPYLFLSAFALLATATSSHAQLIGIQFQAGGTALTSSQTAGVVPQANYNVVTGSSGTDLALVDSSGNPVGDTLTFSADDNYGTSTGTSTANSTLLSGKIGPIIGSTTLTLDNVAAGTYNLILYTETDTTKNLGEYSVGDTTYEITAQAGSAFDGTFIRGTSTPSSATVDTANYVEFENIVVVHSGDDIVLTAGNAPGQNYYSAPFSGLQLQAVDTVSTPEPATWAMMLAGLLAVAGLSRLRRVS